MRLPVSTANDSSTADTLHCIHPLLSWRRHPRHPVQGTMMQRRKVCPEQTGTRPGMELRLAQTGSRVPTNGPASYAAASANRINGCASSIVPCSHWSTSASSIGPASPAQAAGPACASGSSTGTHPRSGQHGVALDQLAGGLVGPRRSKYRPRPSVNSSSANGV